MASWIERLNDARMMDRTGKRDDQAFFMGKSRWGIVTTAHYRATEAGVQMLAKGGNAIDAAVTAALALGVVEPAGSGLGGNAMAMVHLAAPKRTFVLEGPCLAPRKATPEIVAKYPRKIGYKSVAVPTNPCVLGYLLDKYGTIPRKTIFQPAIRMSEEGYTVTPLHYKLVKRYYKALQGSNAGKFMLTDDLQPHPIGTLFKQKVLANTLRTLAANGFSDFYSGEIGEYIVSDMGKNGGFIVKEDLSNIPWPEEREPLNATFNNMTICCPPPPGGGIALIEMLNIFEHLAPSHFNPDSPEAALLFTAIIHQARLDRKRYRPRRQGKSELSYPDLTEKAYAAIAAKKIQSALSGCETTHLNVLDQYGNAVALTQSIERCFGAKVATPALGFLYNGYMKAFKIKAKSHFHYLRPGAVARSNAAPTLIFKSGKPYIAIGSTGSERMISGIFQVLVRLLCHQSPFDAVKAPRLHCTPEREVYYESRISEEALTLIKKHDFVPSPFNSSWSFKTGGLQLAVRENDTLIGVGDPRRDGAAEGPDEL